MRLLVAVDETSEALAAVRVVASLPLSSQDEIVVVCLVESAAAVAYGAGGGPGTAGFLLSPMPSTLVDPGPAIVANVRSILDAVPARRSVAIFEGAPGRVLPDLIAEADADLVVMPARLRRSGLERVVLGDPWADVIARCAVPVLLAREHGETRTALVVAVDATWSATELRALADLPLPADGEVVLVESDARGASAAGGERGTRHVMARWLRRWRAAGRVVARAEVGRSLAMMGGDLGARVIAVGVPRSEAGLRIDAELRQLAASTVGSVLLMPLGMPHGATVARTHRGARSRRRAPRADPRVRPCDEGACHEPAIEIEGVAGPAPSWCITHWLERTGAPMVA